MWLELKGNVAGRSRTLAEMDDAVTVFKRRLIKKNKKTFHLERLGSKPQQEVLIAPEM